MLTVVAGGSRVTAVGDSMVVRFTLKDTLLAPALNMVVKFTHMLGAASEKVRSIVSGT
jgi:hypothetical protein